MNLRNVIRNIMIIFIFPTIIFANSSPVYLEEYPSFNISPMEACPIKVESENLLFKIDEKLPDLGTVTASYTLFNTSAEEQVVPMVFPFVSEGHKGIAPDIKLDGEVVEYKVFGVGHVSMRDYFEDPQAFNEQVNINSIIEQMNTISYKPKYFNDEEKTSLYKITFNKPSKRQSQVSFKIDNKDTRVIAVGFTGYKVTDTGECIVSNYIDERDIGESGYLLVLGEDTLKNIDVSNNDNIEKSTIIIKDYIQDIIKNYEEKWMELGYKNFDNIYALLSKTIDNYYDSQLLVFTENMLWEDTLTKNNISAMVYEVVFQAEEKSILEITYPVEATIDRRKSSEYVNTFAYILNPATNFLDFGKLNIQIELNDRAPYIIESSIPLEEVNKGLYSATLEGLPEKDFVFSTYSKEEISFIESTVENVLPKGYGRFFLMVGTGFIVVVLILSVLIFKTIKKVKK